jgi:cytochrome c oxidase cbb3-type subunit 3
MKEVDKITGIETTGHEWDGIKELNKPLPRWWLWTFYVTIVWSIGYWILYPAWPTLASYTKGTLSYSQRATVTEEVARARAGQAQFREALANIPIEQAKADPDLFRFAAAGGAAAFATNCAPCHGRGAQGFSGYPNLNDDDWIWGGRLADIQQTIRFGVRSNHQQSRSSQMPRYGIDNLMEPSQINDVAEYVLSLTGRQTDEAAARRGKATFQEQCVACHGNDGKGQPEQGAPNLADAIWLYGGTKQAVVESIRTGRGGMMPAWEGRLDPVTVKSLAIYVHSLGGGQ